MSRRTLLLGTSVVLVGAAVAVPRLVGSLTAESSNLAPPTPTSSAPAKSEVAPETSVADVPEEKKAALPEAPKPTVATSADGDLEAVVKLRWPQFESGDRVLAKVAFANHSQRDVYLPAAGEPNQGLAMVVVNADGDEVRRVVESGKGESLPRRMTKLASGFEVEMPLVVVAEDETPLLPGNYEVYAELRPDSRLARLGLPLWKAPHGTLRSEKVALVVTAKRE